MNKSTEKIMFGCIILLLVILIAFVVTMKPSATPTSDTKIASVPTEVKTEKEAASLEKDTSSVLKEVSDTISDINTQLPEV